MTLEKEPDPLRRIPTKHTASLKAEIGPILRAARLKRGQSLEAVAQQTRISKRFLEALENDRFEQFPAIVYLRGFLKGYCEHLDVNFDEVWAMINPAPADPALPNAADAATSAPQAKPAAAVHAPAHGHSQPTHAAAHGSSNPGAGAAPAIILAVILALALVVWLFKDQSHEPSQPAQVTPVALQPIARQIEPKLSIHIKDDAWLRVSVDGQVVFEGRAPRSAVQEWKPVKFVDIRTTEPAALELALNGQPIPLGSPGPDGQYRVDIP